MKNRAVLCGFISFIPEALPWLYISNDLDRQYHGVLFRKTMRYRAQFYFFAPTPDPEGKGEQYNQKRRNK